MNEIYDLSDGYRSQIRIFSSAVPKRLRPYVLLTACRASNIPRNRKKLDNSFDHMISFLLGKRYFLTGCYVGIDLCSWHLHISAQPIVLGTWIVVTLFLSRTCTRSVCYNCVLFIDLSWIRFPFDGGFGLHLSQIFLNFRSWTFVNSHEGQITHF